MLSYRHSFHAGNHADILKHCVYLNCLGYLQRKDTGLRLIDTHSGAGAYTLTSTEVKNAEYNEGIARIYTASSAPPVVDYYLKAIRAFNRQGLKYYPGSPQLAANLLRPQDEAYFFELHSSDYRLLHNRFKQSKRIHVSDTDGFTGLKRLLPSPTRRALVLIDPSYEIKSDYRLVVDALIQAYKRMATGCFLLWYPVVDRGYINSLEKQLRGSELANVQLFELGISPDSHGQGMTASGMIAVNAPWTLREQMETALPWLAGQLSATPQFRIEQLKE
ncbi:23S rRNA (adenine(2030)-N(6))-methyltransferase RlmJ [Gilvimarinus chinensis]|uniref:23S rRNA (adenine(2030)-N(6))-methyltransferase RlmJ n=1 Tax=Gilvimarinus chinensis TaxID=396005 RepID=UPI00037E5036|nr:23S rRNA (adenine(2030)-N(6))-methyltransferase RlmJ [Gilvimarinus chinensis]